MYDFHSNSCWSKVCGKVHKATLPKTPCAEISEFMEKQGIKLKLVGGIGGDNETNNLH
jgi:hypothetical protein